MKKQRALPNPPQKYDPNYMYDLASLVVGEEAKTPKLDQDNVFDKGSIILKSPNGTYYQITVSDTGTLSTSSVPVDTNGRPITTDNPYV